MKRRRILPLLLALALACCLLTSHALADTDVTITISWNDQNDMDGLRPDWVDIQLGFADDTGDPDIGWSGSKKVTVQDNKIRDNTWQYVYQDEYDGWAYYIKDDDPPPGYTVSYEKGATTRQWRITYTHEHQHEYTYQYKEGPYLKSAATCTAPDTYYYACKGCFVSSEGSSGESTYTVGEPLGHKWRAYYSWADDNSSCTARWSCSNDTAGDHRETETVSTSSQVTQEKSCSQAEQTTYTAVFQGENFETRTKVVETAAAGHDWGEASYIWAADNNSCTAQRICKTDASHAETETATATANVTQAQGCLQPELTSYTASFQNGSFDTQTRTDVVTAEAGHDWDEAGYTWAADNSACTAERVCKTDGSHKETETVAAAADVTQAQGCLQPELTSYTADFENPVFVTQSKSDVQTAPATDHDWGEPTYTWAADNKTCTARRICRNDDGHIETEMADSSSVVTQEKSSTLPELTTYTATFGNPVFTEQVKADVKTADPIRTAPAPEAAAEVPSTGDDRAPLLWLGLMAAAAGSLLVLHATGSKRSTK